MPSNAATRLYQFVSYTTVFVVLGFACMVVPKTNLFSINTYHTVALFSTVVLASLYFCVQILKKESRSLIFSIYDVVFFLFITLIFFSSAWARNPVYAYNIGLQWFIFYTVYKLFQHFSSIEKQLHFLLHVLTVFFIISLSIVAILFFATANYSGDLSAIFYPEQFGLIQKYYALHRNSISSLLVLGTGLPLYWILKSTSKWQIVLSYTFLGYFAFVLMLSRSRGSLLAFFTVLFLFYASNFFKKVVNWEKVGFSALLLVLAMFTAFILQSDESNYLSLLNPLYGVQSAEGDGRLQMWEMSFHLISEQPWLGYGAGSWEFEYQKYGAGDLKNHSHSSYFYLHCHNYYIDTWFSIGFFGLVSFVFLILIYPLFSLLKKIKQNEIRQVDYAFFAGLIAFNIVALFYGTMYSNLIKYLGHPILLFAFIGILNHKRKPVLKKTNIVIPIFICFVMIILLTNANNNNLILADYQKDLKSKDYNKCEEALNLLENKKIGFINRRFRVQELKTRLYLKQRKYDLAEKSIKKELEEHPYNFTAWKKMGDTQFKLKKYYQSKDSYYQALLYNCDYIPASIGLLKTEKILKNKRSVYNIKKGLLYIDSYIKQFEINEATWGKHKKLNDIYKSYKKYRKSIDNI